MTNEEIKLLKNFIVWQSLPFVDNLFTHEDEIIKKFDEWLKLNIGSDDKMTNEEALRIAYSKRKDSAGEERDFLNTIIKALEDIEKIKAIIRTPSYFLEQDVYRYKMICEVIANERKTEGKEAEERA